MTGSTTIPSIAEDTIVAVATPPGRGGIGIVRLSGPDARHLLSPHLQLRSPLLPGRARYCAIVDGGARLDEGVVTYFAAPNSYTGEDVLEVEAHGSPVILDLLVRRALEAGARLARPGEFTERAFLHGRIDLTQAEAVRDLIAAETLYQVRVAAEQLGGALSGRVAPVKEQLVALVTLLEAGIDFAEDDIDVTPDAEISRRLDALADEVERGWTGRFTEGEGFFFERTVRGVKDVAMIDDALLGSADARKLDEYAARLQEAYPRPGILRRKDSETAIHGPVSLFEAVTDAGREGVKLQRYKGLGEMDARELWETTMNPAQRILSQVTLDDAAQADELFSVLMGEDVEARRSFITRNAKDVKFLDI